MAVDPQHANATDVPRKASLGRTVRAVAWSFVGLRKGSEYREDLATINPVHVIVVALVGALVFVVGLIAIVHWVV